MGIEIDLSIGELVDLRRVALYTPLARSDDIPSILGCVLFALETFAVGVHLCKKELNQSSIIACLQCGRMYQGSLRSTGNVAPPAVWHFVVARLSSSLSFPPHRRVMISIGNSRCRRRDMFAFCILGTVASNASIYSSPLGAVQHLS